MTHDRAPSRLASSAQDAVLRQIMGAAQTDVPDDARMQRLSAAFAAKLAAAGGAAAGGASASAATEATATAGSAGAGTSAAAAPAATAATGAVAAKVGGIAAVVLAVGATWQLTRAPAQAPQTPPAPTVAAAPAALPQAAPVETAQPKDPIPTVSVDELPTLAPSAAPSAPAASKESEMDLFRQAQAALGSNPSLALALCARHEKEFPRSAFGQERDVLMIDALIRTGRRSEAEARANRFRTAYPRSAHVRRIDSMLGR